jgi:hypothetical protein
MSENSFGDAVTALDAANSSSESGVNTPPAATEPITSFSQSQQPQAPTQQPVNSNPAYAEHLNKIPEGFRGVVEPIFKEWDTNVNQRFEQVHSKYQPYKEIIESGAQPQQLAQALNIYHNLDRDPVAFFNMLQQHLTQQGMLQGAGPGEPADEPEEFDLGDGQTPDPRLSQLEQQQQAIAQQQQAIIQGMQQAQQMRAEADTEQWLDQQMKSAEEYLTKNNIPVNPATWNYVLNVAAGINQSNGGNSDAAFAKAVDMYVENVNHLRSIPTANSTAPAVMPTSGGMPSSNGVPTDLSDQDRRKMAVDMFSQALRG